MCDGGKAGKAPEGSEGDWIKAQLLPEGRTADGAAVSQDGMAYIQTFLTNH